MKINTFVFCLLSLIIISCSKNETQWELTDTDNWKMDDEFSVTEMKLFDSIDFKKTAVFQPLDDGIVRMPPHISILMSGDGISCAFYCVNGNGNEILNLVVVDNSFKKRSSGKVIGKGSYRCDFSGYKSGRYRIYYVMQDSLQRVIYKGHGNLLIEDNTLYITTSR